MVKEIKAYKTSKGHVYESLEEATEMEEYLAFENTWKEIYPKSSTDPGILWPQIKHLPNFALIYMGDTTCEEE